MACTTPKSAKLTKPLQSASPARVTGSAGIKDDLVNAGATWEDAPVVVDRHFVSSRKPDDLPAFCQAILEVLQR